MKSVSHGVHQMLEDMYNTMYYRLYIYTAYIYIFFCDDSVAYVVQIGKKL